MSGRSHENVGFAVPVGVDHDVSVDGKPIDLSLGPVLPELLIAGQFPTARPSAFLFSYRSARVLSDAVKCRCTTRRPKASLMASTWGLMRTESTTTMALSSRASHRRTSASITQRPPVFRSSRSPALCRPARSATSRAKMSAQQVSGMKHLRSVSLLKVITRAPTSPQPPDRKERSAVSCRSWSLQVENALAIRQALTGQVVDRDGHTVGAQLVVDEVLDNRPGAAGLTGPDPRHVDRSRMVGRPSGDLH